MTTGYNPVAVVTNEIRKAAANGLTIPAPLADHFADVDKLSDAVAAIVATDPMADAIAEIRKTGKVSDKTAVAAAAREVRITAANAALDDARREFGLILAPCKEELIDSVRDEVYSPAMDALRDLAKRVSATDTVEGLMRAGRVSDAQDLVAAETHARQVRKAHELVGKIHPRSPKNMRTYYRTEADAVAKALSGASPLNLDGILRALETGAEPWLPSVAELEAAIAYVSPEEREARAKSKSYYGDAPAFYHNA